MPDYYQVLGIQKTASKDDIKKAYRKAALRTHPDRVPADQKKQAEDAFRAVNAAYEILSHDANRAVYDKHGVWPPPATKTKKYQPKPQAAPEYKPFPNPYPHFEGDGATHPHFVFTDPFALFNMIFADLYQQQQSHAAAAAYHMRRQPIPGYPDPFGAAPFVQFPSFAQTATNFTGQPPPPQQQPHLAPHRASQPASRTESPATDDDRNQGWIKESKVTKVTPSGARETTIKKTAPDGTVYITRIGGDGIERHYILVNGVEKPTSTAPPVTPPRVPLSQTQGQQPPFARADFGQPPSSQPQASRTSSSRHAASASQPVNTTMPSGSTRERSAVPSTSQHPSQPSASTAPQPVGHRRSASRAGQASQTSYAQYRAASPTPMASHERAPGYPFAPPSTGRRATSPGPNNGNGSGSGSENPTSRSKPSNDPLKRNHTLPNHVLQEQAQAAGGLPRPQSPHFYRTRATSEHRKQPEVIPKAQTYRPKEPREDPSYVLSDNEASRARPAAYRPSRSSHSYPVPADAGPQHRPMSTQPQQVPQHRTMSTQPQQVPQPPQQQSQPSHQQPPPMQPRPSTHRSSHTQKQPPPPLQPTTYTNELGLGFVPPPSAGLPASHRASYASVQNEPLNRASRNNSYEEIVYPHRKGSTYGAQPPQPQYMYGGNPMPNPPVMPNPQMMRDPYAQPTRYRQTAA